MTIIVLFYLPFNMLFSHWLSSMLDEDSVKALKDWLIRLKRYESCKRGIFLGIEII